MAGVDTDGPVVFEPLDRGGGKFGGTCFVYIPILEVLDIGNTDPVVSTPCYVFQQSKKKGEPPQVGKNILPEYLAGDVTNIGFVWISYLRPHL